MITLRIVRDGDDWEIVPVDVDLMKKRHKDHKDRMLKLWKNRKPKLFTEPFHGHDPIVFFENEAVQFECEDATVPFGIGATPNSDVHPLPGAPENPFGWSGIQLVNAGDHPQWTVTETQLDAAGNVVKLGPKAQGFFKFHGWVFVDGQFLAWDPDGYCGG